MKKPYVITLENVKELQEAMEKKENAPHYKKLEAVALRGKYDDNTIVGTITGIRPELISRLVSIYCKNGLNALLVDGRHRNMSEKEEREFLAQFKEAALKGQIKSLSIIKKAYAKKMGKKYQEPSTIYYLLRKHGWKFVNRETTTSNNTNSEEIKTSHWRPPE
ncbi:MAG: hypothetical protein LBE76_09595 [Nitrososphaerota archaeon]|jgi:hypothetical protein|nr:hypothetical protein [Nitrososphaerota archaeon]